MKVLIVDDDPDLLGVTAFALQQAGFLVVRATDGVSALEVFEQEQPDLAVLDINLPRRSGFELARAIRKGSPIPIIMLTVRSEDEDVVRALDLRADDYLTKPFSPRILIARINALLRRASAEAGHVLSVSGLTLDLDKLVLVGLTAVAIRLTPLEARFLQLLMANAGRTVATERILAHVWGSRSGGNRQLLKQLVHRLRQKVETMPGMPRLLRTVPGSGYYIDPESISAAN
jgi:DNA-binding response OmpR family regulator